MSLTQERGAGAAGAALETGVMQMPSMRLLPTRNPLHNNPFWAVRMEG